ncbi:hypothetical protein H1S01_01980 [Heliobacterium chlorum]|uniref:Uncharacterized protein n=1 Tax=Heliobacterium chlorum TaxID=2698 RepID=A0ABR7SZI8_HELCL|nr:hypothetical protein [Heliobacterium chlorum]MBC9783277.1 hypothetical protein [Heliobacterium chlorum]
MDSQDAVDSRAAEDRAGEREVDLGGALSSLLVKGIHRGLLTVQYIHRRDLLLQDEKKKPPE